MPSSIWRRCGSPVVMPTSQIAATHAGRVLIARHLVVFLVADLRRVSFPLAFELYVGHLLDEKLGHARLGNIGILQHDAESDPLVIAFGEFESNLPPIREIQPSRSLLHLSPVRPNINLLGERDLYQILDRFFERLSGKAWRTGIAGYVNHQSH